MDRFDAFIYEVIAQRRAALQNRNQCRGKQCTVSSNHQDTDDETSTDEDSQLTSMGDASPAGISLSASALTLLDLMILATLEKRSNMSDEELRNNVVLFFVAGHETTATSLLVALHSLSMVCYLLFIFAGCSSVPLASASLNVIYIQ